MDNNNNKKYSQFRAMMALAKASFTSTMKSPSAVVFTLVFPLIFIVVFGFIGGGAFSVDVAVNKQIDTTDVLYQGLRKSPVINFITDKTPSEIQSELEKGTLDAYLDFHKTTGATGPHYVIDIKTSAASADKARIFMMVMNQFTDKMNLARVPQQQQIAEIRSSEVSGRKYTRIDFILPGQLGFSLLSTGVFGTAFVFFALRQTLVLKRFFATPVRREFIVLGEAMSRITFALLGALFILLIGYFAFNFTLVNGISTVLNMMVLSAIGVIVFMGFGFIISGVARNDNAIPPLANIITLPQFLLSGTFFSIKAFPVWLQHISNVLPLTYLNEAMRKVAFEGVSLIGVGKEILILLLWGVGVYIVAAKTFRWE
jgi:ABC-2 type transport system permease protein